MNMKVTLTEKWSCQIDNCLKQLLSSGFYFSKRTDLQSALIGGGRLADDMQMKLAIKYYNIRNRIPTQRKRMIRECNGISCPAHLQLGFEMLKQELKDGCCLIPRMSRATKDFDACDGMLNDWGIQHFHLGVSPDVNHPDFVQGDNHIAYVYMTDDVAYIITIDVHGKWGEKALLEKLLMDFPNALDDWKTDAHELAFEADGKERESLRKAHVNSAVVLNGLAYMRPNGGEALDGSSASAVWDALQDRKFLVRVCDTVNDMLIKCGWKDIDICNSRLINFRRGPSWFVQMEKVDGSSCALISLENGMLGARVATRVV